MKKIFIYTTALVVFAACSQAPKADNAATGNKKEAAVAEGTIYTADSTSGIEWTGTKATGQHTGTFKLKEGALAIKDNTVTGGSFVIDMTSLAGKDLANDAENKAKLEGHLKSPDFFDVARFPTAKFEITSVVPYVKDNAEKAVLLADATHTITGNFTLKDSTKSISFPAKISISDIKATAIADFNIDRTLWGLNYKGPNNPQDWFISKTVNLKVSLSVSKK